MDSYHIKAIGRSEAAIHDFADVLEEDGLNMGVALVSIEAGHDGEDEGPSAAIVRLTWTTAAVCVISPGVFSEYFLERLKERFAGDRDRFVKEETDGHIGIIDAKNGARIVFGKERGI